MRLIIFICFLLACTTVFSQRSSSPAAFNNIDYKSGFVDSDDPALLSQQLAALGQTDKEKVRAFFKWIADHIGYYKQTPQRAKRRTADAMYEEEDDDDLSPLKPVTERIAIKVLKDRRTHCEGYARLFKSLCDHAGITCEIITGYARTDLYRMEARFRTNHSWNAVYFDSSWHLLDVTWASGYIGSFSGDFVKSYNDYYFLTKPEDFAKHHLPDDMKWTLLDNPPAPEEFRRAPFHQRSFIKYGITDFYPSRGIIEASIGDTVRVELETTIGLIRPVLRDSIWENPTITPVAAYVNPGSSLLSNKVYYNYPVESGKVEWLYIMYNNDAVLRYKLNIKEKALARN